MRKEEAAEYVTGKPKGAPTLATGCTRMETNIPTNKETALSIDGLHKANHQLNERHDNGLEQSFAKFESLTWHPLHRPAGWPHFDYRLPFEHRYNHCNTVEQPWYRHSIEPELQSGVVDVNCDRHVD